MSFTVKKILSVGAVLGLGITVLTTARNAAAQEEISDHPLVYAVKPLVGGDMATIEAQSQASTGLKMFTYSIKSTRTGSVGQSAIEQPARDVADRRRVVHRDVHRE